MKKRSTFMTLLTLLSSAAFGQSVYQCLPFEAPISQSQTFPAGNIFRQNCVLFQESTPYLYQVGHDIEIEANKQIVIEPGFQAGLMQTNGSMSLKLGEQPAGYDVHLMSSASLESLPRYTKVEFGVQLPTALHDRIEAFVHPSAGNTANPLNPYLPSKLDIQMTFTHEFTGVHRRADAFYFQDFNRNIGSNDWEEIATAHPMRVRFSPSLNGRWKVQTTIKVENGTTINLLPFYFQVAESGKQGFVSVHPNKRNLQRGNRIIYPVGHNFSSPYTGVDIWSCAPTETNKAARVDDWLSYHQNVIDYAEEGGKYIRTLQSAYSSLIEFEELGNYTNRLHFAWEQDKLLETCEQYDVLMQFNLMQQEPIMKYGNWYMSRWDFGHWKMDGTIDNGDPYPAYCYYTYPGKEPREMFTDPTDFAYHMARTRYYISRYGYSPQIYEFEVVNEPFHLGELWHDGGSNDNGVVLNQATKDAITTYNVGITSYIKNNLEHIDHLVGINLRMELHVGDPAVSSDFSNLDESVWYTIIDIIGFNPYADAPEKLIITKDDNDKLGVEDDENSFYARNSVLHELAEKPIIYSEAGHVNNSCSNWAGHYKDVMTFGFTGAAGFNMWSGGEINPEAGIDESILWASTIRAQNHMNGNDVIYTLASDGNNSGLWKQGREYADFDGWEKIKEHEYYVSNDKLRAVGYVYNRTYNVFTTQNAATCANPIDPFASSSYNQSRSISWDPDVMKIDGLFAGRWYTIDYYSYKEGIYVASECRKTNAFGKLDLVHPQMEPTGNPVLWYVVRRQDCNNKMSEQDAFEDSDMELEQSLSLSIYPNPNAGVFDLLIESDAGKAVSIKIFNLLGQQVYFKDQVSEKELRLETGLKAGIYFLKVEDGQSEQTKKFVVQ